MGNDIDKELINVTLKCDECGAQNIYPSINCDAKVGQKWNLECPTNGCNGKKAKVINIEMTKT